MQIIDGKATAATIKAEIKEEVERLVAQGVRRPHLAAILVGHDGGSETYVKNKVLEFAGPGLKYLPYDFRSGIDVMTTETTCLSSIWQTDDEISTVRKMENTYAGKAEKLEEALRPYHLVAHEYRFRSFFTWPGVWDICTFPKEDFSRELVKNIYLGAGVSIGDYDFEDLGFRDKEGNLWMRACLHEGFFEMDLSDEQLAEFKKLEIPFEKID